MITITLAPCVGVDKPFAAVTKETVALTGADVPDGLQVALFDGAGACLAVADVQNAQATLDLDTQEAVDATAPVGPGEAVTAWLVVGDKTTHVATIPCKLIRNLIDDGAVHPSVPAERYPTVNELAKWLQEVETIAGKVTDGASRAEQSATTAEKAAERAHDYASDASNASTSAAKSYENAEASRKAAESAAQVARDARENAQLQKQQATAAAGNANGYRQQAQNAQRLAERAQEAAEAAQQAAEEAQNAADGFASDAAQSAQEAGAKADEANQAATDAGSANRAAQSAKTAAEAAAKAAEAAKADAQSAKAGAESAKASAEAAAGEAATSATQAATSATAAAASAEAAQEAAQGLQEGLAALNTLDGRVTFLETGEGVYKDPSTGKVKTYKPLPGSDGTIKITKELPQFYKILPVEEDYATSHENIAISDGVYYVFYCGAYSANRIYFYDFGMNRIGKIPNSGRNVYPDDSGAFALFTASDGHLRAAGTYTSIYGNSSAMLWDVTAGELLKIVGIKAIRNNNDGMDSIYNPASGHILTREAAVKREDDATRYDFAFLVWDEDLSPVLDEATGEQKRVDANGVFYDNGYTAEEKKGKLDRSRKVRVFQAPFDNKVYFTSTSNNAGLFTFGVDDAPIQIKEHIPVEDPDNPGYCLCEKNEDGTLKREWTDRGCYFPRLVTQELGPALFMRSYPEEYGLKAGGNGNGVSGPAFLQSQKGYDTTRKEYKSCFRDLAFCYIVTPDNKLINTVFFNNEFLTETKAPRYTYQMPIIRAADYGKFPWPTNPHLTMLLPKGYEVSAMMFPHEQDETRTMAIKGNNEYDNANPFVPLINLKHPFCPIVLNGSKEGRSASPNVNGAYVVFDAPMWCTNYELAYAGNLT